MEYHTNNDSRPNDSYWPTTVPWHRDWPGSTVADQVTAGRSGRSAPAVQVGPLAAGKTVIHSIRPTCLQRDTVHPSSLGSYQSAPSRRMDPNFEPSSQLGPSTALCRLQCPSNSAGSSVQRAMAAPGQVFYLQMRYTVRSARNSIWLKLCITFAEWSPDNLFV